MSENEVSLILTDASTRNQKIQKYSISIIGTAPIEEEVVEEETPEEETVEEEVEEEVEPAQDDTKTEGPPVFDF